jgi:hypothetical protein
MEQYMLASIAIKPICIGGEEMSFSILLVERNTGADHAKPQPEG